MIEEAISPGSESERVSVRLLEDFVEPGSAYDALSSENKASTSGDGSEESQPENDNFGPIGANALDENILVSKSPVRDGGDGADVPLFVDGQSADRSIQKASTLAEGRDEGLAAAFSEILAHPGPANIKNKAPILLASKSVAKRHRQEEEAAAVQKAAKKLRQEMRKRGHVGVPKKGEDPQVDAHEKMLYKTANRGVVQLFNAVSKAQRVQKEALASGAKQKDARINKSTFFEELRGKAPLKKGEKPAIGPQEPKQDAGKRDVKLKPLQLQKGWDVLDESFAGLQGSAALKMKDWDKQGNEAADLGPEVSDSEEGDLEDW